MIYCIGMREKYQSAFAAGPVTKQGRGRDVAGRPYPGGWVWRTVEDARRFIAMQGLNATHDVYGVLADWERDTEPAEDNSANRLIRDAEVIRLT